MFSLEIYRPEIEGVLGLRPVIGGLVGLCLPKKGPIRRQHRHALQMYSEYNLVQLHD